MKIRNNDVIFQSTFFLFLTDPTKTAAAIREALQEVYLRMWKPFGSRCPLSYRLIAIIMIGFGLFIYIGVATSLYHDYRAILRQKAFWMAENIKY